MALGAPASDLPLALPAPSAELVQATWVLDPPPPHERGSLLRPEAAELVDGLLGAVARSRGALDVALGAVLDQLSIGDRLLRLGYSSLGDYVRERLGIGEATGRNMKTLARALRDRPLLNAAVRASEVTTRKALAVLRVAHGDEEAEWVERARTETVRALEKAVRAAVTAAPPEESWQRVEVALGPDDRAQVDRALEIAGRLLGAGAPRWQRLEAICQEWLGTFPGEPPAGCDGEDVSRDLPPDVLTGHPADWLAAAKEALEVETQRWSFLAPVAPVPAPPAEPPEAGGDAGLDRALADPAVRLDARACELAAMRDHWDLLLGHNAMLMKHLGLWREAGFASFGHYCEERLGMAARTVEQRAWVARRCYALPGLREAMADGRLTYEKARLVAQVADDRTFPEWLARAQASTCIELRRAIEAEEDTQMCARGELALRVPRHVGGTVHAAIQAAREAAWDREGRRLTPGEALGRIAAHFLATWEPALPRRKTPSRRILERDRCRCSVPGCSRPAVHVHHVTYRSAGGGDEPSNLVSLCAAHHLHAVHLGWIRVKGTAPDGFRWRLPAPPR